MALEKVNDTDKKPRSEIDINDPQHDILLKDGTVTLVRFLKPENREELVRGFGRLSFQSRYHRFLTPITELSAKQLTYLTEIDNKDNLALCVYIEHLRHLQLLVALKKNISISKPSETGFTI